MKTKILVSASLGAMLIVLGGCQKKATGQVAAVVNGEEISLQELNSELQGMNIPESADRKKVLATILQRVIDRKLLVQKAKEQGIDKDPQFLTQERRLTENLMVQMLGAQAAKTTKVPDAGTVDKFVADNPTLFSQRTRYQVDQIQFPIPADMNALKPLENDHSLDQVAKHLDELKIHYARGKAVLDSANVPAPLLAKILALPAGEPFVVPANGRMTASVIIAKQAVEVPADMERQQAADLLRRRDLEAVMSKQVKTARDSAKIEYQPGYEPPKPTPAPKAAS